MNVLVPQQGLEDLVASYCVALNLHFDRAHEADEHRAIRQLLERSRLRQEHFQDFRENLVVEEVYPEAPLYDLLILPRFRSVEYTLKGNLD